MDIEEASLAGNLQGPLRLTHIMGLDVAQAVAFYVAVVKPGRPLQKLAANQFLEVAA